MASAITSATGAASTCELRLLTVIDDVTEGDWGGRGSPLSLENPSSLRSASGRTVRVLGWSRSYFAAKARAVVMAGFPADMGGLPPVSMSREVEKALGRVDIVRHHRAARRRVARVAVKR